MRRVWICLLLVCVGVFAVPTSAAAQPTAAEVALLLNKMDAPAVETVRNAIGASDPMVRTVAARIAAVTAHPPFASALDAAFAKEGDPLAVKEQVRALLFLRGLQATETIEARMSALPAIGQAYAAVLAGTQPERFAEALPKIVSALGDKRGDMPFNIRVALGKGPSGAERLLRNWLSVSTAAEWAMSLDAVHRQIRPGQDAVLIEAMTTASADIREATIWDLVARLARNQPISTAPLDAIAPAATPTPPTDDIAVTWEQFGRELIARRHRARTTPDRSAFLAAEASKQTSRAIAVARMTQTLETERKVLQEILGESFPKSPSSSDPSLAARPGQTMRTVPMPWPGFVKQVLEAAKCTPAKSPTFGATYAIYRPNGTVATIELMPLPVPGGCEPALTALGRLTLMNFDYPPRANEGEVLVLPLGREAVECAQEASQYVREPHTVSSGTDRQGRKIIAPRKVRDVRPVYPQAMQQRRVQGRVVLESVISHAGCVINLEVMGSVDPMLDLAALRAISQWTFTPTSLDGQPVPVSMTVSINFSLQ